MRMTWWRWAWMYFRLWKHDICPKHLCKIVKGYNHRGCPKCDNERASRQTIQDLAKRQRELDLIAEVRTARKGQA